MFKKIYDKIISFANKITGNSKESLFIKDLKNKWEKAYRESSLETAKQNLENNDKLSLSKNALQEVSDIVNQTREQSEIDNRQFVKLKDNTIKALVDYGIKDLPMLERNGHVRENILTEAEAKKLGYSTKNKHYHGLGVKTYLEIIDSMDNPISVYQYTDKGKYSEENFIVLTPIDINGVKAIVPIEINQRGQYNQVEIDYNKIKTTYSKDSDSYIDNLLKAGKIKEIFTGSNSQQTSLTENNISQNTENVNKNDTLSNKYSMQNTENNTWQEHLKKNYKSDGTKTYFKDTRFDNTENKTKHLDPTKESSYGPVKKKGQIYNLDKLIEFV